MKALNSLVTRRRRGRDRIVVGFTSPVQSVLLTTNVASSNPVQARCTRYVIKFVSDRSVVFSGYSGFLDH